MFIALIAGTLGGGLLGFALSLRIVQHIAAVSRPNFVYWAASIGAVTIAIPSFFIAVVMGGNLGGGAGAAVAERFGFDALGASFGVAIGLGLVLAAGLVCGACTGALLGRAISGASHRA